MRATVEDVLRVAAKSRFTDKHKAALKALVAGPLRPHKQLELFRLAAEFLHSSGAPGETIASLLVAVYSAITADDRAATQMMVPTEVHFSPTGTCRQRLERLIQAATRSIHLCLYTIADDRLTEKLLLAAKRRGLTVRLVAEADTASDCGSDIGTLLAGGVEVRLEQSPALMHHKFAVVDDLTLVTGSMNWTRSALTSNFENLIITQDRKVVRTFAQEFARLWAQLDGTTE